MIPLQLETTARGPRRTCGAALKQIYGMGTRRYVHCPFTSNEEEVDNDKKNESGGTSFFGVVLTMEDDE